MPRTAAWIALIALIATAGCATVGGGQGAANSLLPTRNETLAGPFLVYTHEPIPADSPAIRQLHALERRVGSTLGLHVETYEPPIEVYILGDRAAFDHFLRIYYPELPSRRAFFLAQEKKRVMYTYFNPLLEVDLRHEGTHALLSASGIEPPLWLDEGLAEYFEVPEDAIGVNSDHLGRLPDDRMAGWSPDIAHLERIKDSRQMSPRDYRESWAWVHFLLNGPADGRPLLVRYLADLKKGGTMPPLSQQIGAATPIGPRLLVYLDNLREPRKPAAVRLQDTPEPEPIAIEPPRGPVRGLFGRIFDKFRD